MTRQYKHGSKRTWELALEAVRKLGGSASTSEIQSQILKTESQVEYKKTNLSPDLTTISVNNPTRLNFSQNLSARRSDSGNVHDALFKHGKGKTAIYELYDPNKHGIWEIYIDSKAKTGFSVRKLETQKPMLALIDTKQDAENYKDLLIFPDEVPDINNYFEGAKTSVLVNSYERNSKARTQSIEYYGAICKVCDFDFEKKYGSIGAGFIHVHHLTPLADIKAEYVVDPITDLRPVCPNCHAMLHKKQPPYSIEELRSKLTNNYLENIG